MRKQRTSIVVNKSNIEQISFKFCVRGERKRYAESKALMVISNTNTVKVMDLKHEVYIVIDITKPTTTRNPLFPKAINVYFECAVYHGKGIYGKSRPFDPHNAYSTNDPNLRVIKLAAFTNREVCLDYECLLIKYGFANSTLKNYLLNDKRKMNNNLDIPRKRNITKFSDGSFSAYLY